MPKAKANPKATKGLNRRSPKAERAPEIHKRLLKTYPDAHCALDFNSPYQLTVATILSAQCTDKRVNMVTPTLFAKYPSPRELAAAKRQVEQLTEAHQAAAAAAARLSAEIAKADASDNPATQPSPSSAVSVSTVAAQLAGAAHTAPATGQPATDPR
jgi:hypothetical protein